MFTKNTGVWGCKVEYIKYNCSHISNVLMAYKCPTCFSFLLNIPLFPLVSLERRAMLLSRKMNLADRWPLLYFVAFSFYRDSVKEHLPELPTINRKQKWKTWVSISHHCRMKGDSVMAHVQYVRPQNYNILTKMFSFWNKIPVTPWSGWRHARQWLVDQFSVSVGVTEVCVVCVVVQTEPGRPFLGVFFTLEATHSIAMSDDLRMQLFRLSGPQDLVEMQSPSRCTTANWAVCQSCCKGKPKACVFLLVNRFLGSKYTEVEYY